MNYMRPPTDMVSAAPQVIHGLLHCTLAWCPHVLSSQEEGQQATVKVNLHELLLQVAHSGTYMNEHAHKYAFRACVFTCSPGAQWCRQSLLFLKCM